MGRHSAPRRHGPVVALGAAAVVGSAGIAWALGGGPGVEPGPDAVDTTSARPTSIGIVTAPSPSTTGTARPLVRVVPAVTSAAAPPSAVGSTTDPTGEASAPEASSHPKRAATATPTPTRTRPGRGVVPTPRPTKPHK